MHFTLSFPKLLRLILDCVTIGTFTFALCYVAIIFCFMCVCVCVITGHTTHNPVSFYTVETPMTW